MDYAREIRQHRPFSQDIQRRLQGELLLRLFRQQSSSLRHQYPQYTTEWAVPVENARKCLLEIQKWVDLEYADPHGVRPHFPIEIRFTDADDIWLSPGYKQRMCWIGLIQFK